MTGMSFDTTLTVIFFFQDLFICIGLCEWWRGQRSRSESEVKYCGEERIQKLITIDIKHESNDPVTALDKSFIH